MDNPGQTPDSEDAAERLRRSFGDTEWQNMSEYNADEKVGTRVAICKEGMMGFFPGEWDGGSDGVPEITGQDTKGRIMGRVGKCRKVFVMFTDYKT